MDVSLVLTHDCNLGCGYCYTGAKFPMSLKMGKLCETHTSSQSSEAMSQFQSIISLRKEHK